LLGLAEAKPCHKRARMYYSQPNMSLNCNTSRAALASTSLERVESSPFRLLILETNGILIGSDLDYAQQIARFRKVHTRVSMTADPRIVRKQERQSLLDRLASIDPALVRNLEEEVVNPYHTTLKRLQHAGIELEWRDSGSW